MKANVEFISLQLVMTQCTQLCLRLIQPQSFVYHLTSPRGNSNCSSDIQCLYWYIFLNTVLHLSKYFKFSNLFPLELICTVTHLQCIYELIKIYNKNSSTKKIQPFFSGLSGCDLQTPDKANDKEETTKQTNKANEQRK